MSLTEMSIAKDEKKYGWSERIRNLASLASKPYSKKLETKLKRIVCDRAAANPESCLDPRKTQPIVSLQESIELFLANP
jgi:hypothetical protein